MFSGPMAGALTILAVSLAFAIRALADARARAKMAETGTPEVVRAILASEEEKRRLAALRWGIVLTCLAGAFGIIAWAGWEEPTPGAIAALLGATGIGNLLHFGLVPVLRRRDAL